MKLYFNPNEETICGEKVTAEKKALWNVETDIMHEFDMVCQKNNLRWYAIGGTLLGAVRHKGFIPWDDDIDVAMPLEDYKRFCEIGEREFKYPYFFQLYNTDSYAAPWHVKIRRSDTTGYTVYEGEKMPDSYNKGVFFDVFPLCDIPDNIIQRKILYKKLSFLKRIINLKRKREAKKENLEEWENSSIRNKIISLIFIKAIDYNRLCDWYIKQSNKARKGEKIGLLSIFPGKKNIEWPRKAFEETTELQFGNMMIKAPKDFKTVLTYSYGDYMIPIKGIQLHTELFFDINKPYSQYYAEKKAINTDQYSI